MRKNTVEWVANKLKEKYEKGELKPNFSRIEMAKELGVKKWNVYDAIGVLKKMGVNTRKPIKMKRLPGGNKLKYPISTTVTLHPTLDQAIELVGSVISVIKAVGTPEQVAEFFKRYEK
jgi:glutamate synthase domain-containing protein 1